MPIDRSKLPTLSIGDDSNRGLSREGTRTTAHARARRRITQMLSREPPRSTVGYLHGERNTPKFRFKDPRNAKRERQNWAKPGKEHSGRRCWMQVYTNRDHVANAHRKDSTLWAVRCQAAGRVKKNVEPLSGSDSIQIRPPWRSTIFRQIASPIPV